MHREVRRKQEDMLKTVVGALLNETGMLDGLRSALRWALTIWPQSILGSPYVDHRFYSEYVTNLHLAFALVAWVVRDCRGRVK